MKAKQFNELKKEVKNGNLKELKKEVIQDLTLKQAQAIEDAMLDLELNKEGNRILDLVVAFIDSTAVEKKRVANKKVPAKKEAPEAPTEVVKPEVKKSAKKPAKKSAKKPAKKESPTKKLTDTLKVGDTVKFQVEGEEIQHDIKIVHIGKYNIIGVMAVDEKEVFNIRKVDFNRQVFAWTDRHNETYNIIVTL